MSANTKSFKDARSFFDIVESNDTIALATCMCLNPILKINHTFTEDDSNHGVELFNAKFRQAVDVQTSYKFRHIPLKIEHFLKGATLHGIINKLTPLEFAKLAFECNNMILHHVNKERNLNKEKNKGKSKQKPKPKPKVDIKIDNKSKEDSK